MKKRLTTSDIVNALLADDNARWTRAGAHALAEYLEEYEADCGIELELDVVALRCEYSEYDSALEWAEEHFGFDALVAMIPDDIDSDEEEAWCRDYIQEHGQLIECWNDGVIVSNF